MIVAVPLASGEVIELELSPETETSLAQLPHRLAAYFDTSTGGEIPIAFLVQSRVRPDGVAAAAGYMAAAARDEIPKREPVSLRRLGIDQWLVLDGNSTVTVARAAGWPSIWAVDTATANPPV
jgi:hypothetical protein